MKKTVLLSFLCLLFSVATCMATPPPPCSVKLSIVDSITCITPCSGTLVAVTTGTAPFIYTWSQNASSDSVATALCGGKYVVSMTDSLGCTAVDSLVLAQPDSFKFAATIVNVACGGICTGSIHIAFSGGTPPYQYAWDSGDTTKNLDGICGGNYCIFITDSLQCTFGQCNLNVNEPDPLYNQLYPSQFGAYGLSCNGDSSGFIETSVAGGTPPFIYNWFPTDTGNAIFNLVAGTYIVTITDSNGCSVKDTAILTQPPPFNIMASLSDYNGWGTKCNGDSTGFICISVSGETPPYYYVWQSIFSGDSCVSGLVAGSYCMSVSDANSCYSGDTCFTLTEPDPIMIDSSHYDPSCIGCTDGVIMISASGGARPYVYIWSPNVSTDSIATGLGAGTYTVCVTDANACSTVCDTITVNPVSVQNFERDLSLTVSPNPSDGRFSIVFHSALLHASMRIVNLLGQEVYSDSFSSQAEAGRYIDMKAPEGIYFIKITSESGNWVGRIVKE